MDPITTPTKDDLTRAHNQFWLWVLPIWIFGAVIAAASPSAVALMGLIVYAVIVWRVWILARVLRLHWWTTAIYCVCCIVPILYLVPLIGIGSSFSKVRQYALRVEHGLA